MRSIVVLWQGFPMGVWIIKPDMDVSVLLEQVKSEFEASMVEGDAEATPWTWEQQNHNQVDDVWGGEVIVEIVEVRNA